jgi:hypothetical protein
MDIIQDWIMDRLADKWKLCSTLPSQSTGRQNVHTYVAYVDNSPEFSLLMCLISGRNAGGICED